MCGIIGYIGSREAQPILLAGLKRLEYRGYDSSGIATVLSRKKAISIRKSPGKIIALEKLLSKKPLDGVVGIAHTRWATHGQPNQVNSHPHDDCEGQIAIVHNGIIENYESIKNNLIKEGHFFKSQTDTEVIVHLIEKFYTNIPLEEAVRKALKLLVGSFAIGVISQKEPNKLIGARLGSPLIVGLGKKENFLASDVPAILEYTKDIIYLEENELAILDADSIKVTNLDGKEIHRKSVHIQWDIAQAQKQGYPYFMLKEINEQPTIIHNLLGARMKSEDNEIAFEEQNISVEKLKEIKDISIVACGTAYHAGLVGKYILESVCSFPVSIDVSSEFRYRNIFADEHTS